MKYQARTTLKKKDTDGGVPSTILDQYIRTELTQSLLTLLKPYLSIQRHEESAETALQIHKAQVEFTTELVMLHPEQWIQIKQWLTTLDVSLPPNQQTALQQLIVDAEKRAE